MKAKLFITIIILIIYQLKTVPASFSQDNGFHVNVYCTDCPSLERYLEKKTFNDSAELILSINEIINSYQTRGYLTASLDSIVWHETEVGLYIYKGNQYEKLFLKNSSFITPVLTKKYIKKLNRGLTIQEYDKTFDQVISYFENQGYPFANIGFDSIEARATSVLAAITIDESTRVPFDDLKFEGMIPLKKVFLGRYLSIERGNWFSKKKLNDIDDKLGRLSYLQLKSSPSLRFHHDTAFVSLQLAKRKASFFDGFIGFFPNQEGVDNQETLITGKVDLKLVNPFKTGKQIAFFWNRQKELSQTLKINYYHPLILASPLSLDLSFQLFKEDTAFITRSTEISVIGQASEDFNFRLTFQRKTGDLLSGADRNVSVQNNLLNTDYEIISYGLGLSLIRLDDYLNPRKGNSLDLSTEIGKRTLGDNANINDPLFNRNKVEELRTALRFQHRWYIPLTNFLSLYHSFETKHLITPSSFLNDMYRLGGLLNLRGFNDNFFFASNYALSNLEARLHFETYSYFFLLYDQSWIYYRINDIDQVKDAPLGLGAGINLDTGTGILKFVYAIGKSEQFPFDFRQSKVHIGFEARF